MKLRVTEVLSSASVEVLKDAYSEDEVKHIIDSANKLFNKFADELEAATGEDRFGGPIASMAITTLVSSYVLSAAGAYARHQPLIYKSIAEAHTAVSLSLLNVLHKELAYSSKFAQRADFINGIVDTLTGKKG